jgi:AraC-like DNA-binding protein
MKIEDAWELVDPLGEALHFLRMSGTFYCRSELTAPWALALPAASGCLCFHHPAASRLVDLLPAMIHVEASTSPEPQTNWMQSTLRLMAAEAMRRRPGGETVITRLADVLVIQAIRSWIERDPVAKTGWLGALQDKQLGRAITLIHRDPAHPWTVASLASAVAMSRSVFSARFTELVGESPMQYVTRWRMHLATTWLKDDDAGLGELAGRLGYQSEAAFGRAFKRFVGISPGAVRKDAKPSGDAGDKRR